MREECLSFLCALVHTLMVEIREGRMRSAFARILIKRLKAPGADVTVSRNAVVLHWPTDPTRRPATAIAAGRYA
jgi:hypothetical protein